MTSEAALADTPRMDLEEALVLDVANDERVVVRPISGRGVSPREARVAVLGYHPAAGDRVVVADSGNGTSFLVGVVKAAHGATIATRGGASAEVEGDRILVRDNAGRIAVVFDAESGGAEIRAPEGDLRLSAGAGSVVLDAAVDVVVSARRDVRHVAARRVEIGCEGQDYAAVTVAPNQIDIATEACDVTADRTSVHVGEASLLAEKIITTANDLELLVGRASIRAERWFERIHDVYREVDGLLQVRAGRVRTLVRETYQLHSRRASLVSEEETSIDGKRVLLG